MTLVTRQQIAQALTDAALARVRYTPDQRVRYRCTRTNKAVPGVTTILSDMVHKHALIPWAANCATEHLREVVGIGGLLTEESLQEARRAHDAKRDAGAEVGRIVHDCLHAWLVGDPWETYFPDDPDARKSVEAGLAWIRRRFEPGIIGAEVTLVAPEGEPPAWCGTTDLVCVIDGELAVVDWKSTKSGLYAEGCLQIAAYAHACEAALTAAGMPLKVQQTILVHVDRETGEPHELVADRSEWQQDYEAFSQLVMPRRRLQLKNSQIKKWREAREAVSA